MLHRWLLDQRLQLAEELLESTTLPVDEVAARSGLGSPDTLRITSLPAAASLPRPTALPSARGV